MYDRSSKCWFLLCLFIYPAHSEVTPGASYGRRRVCWFGRTHTFTDIPPPYTHTHTHTHTTTTHQAQHLAAISKNITLEKRWKNTSLVWWRRRERERWRSNGPKPLSHLLIFYRTLTTERQVCSAVFAVQPPPPNAFT